MLLPGRLSETTLGDLLGKLHRSRVTGVLELIGHHAPYAGVSHRIVLNCGMVADVQTPLRVAPIGEILLGERAISPDQHQKFVRLVDQYPTVPAGVLLMDDAHVPPEVLSDGLTLQMKQRLHRLLELQEATIRFHPAGTRAHRGVEARVLTPEEFLHGLPRARDRQASPDASSPMERNAFDPWSILGVERGASRSQIRRAFRRLALTLHPDLNQDLDDSAHQHLVRHFARVTAAYHAIVAGQAA